MRQSALSVGQVSLSGVGDVKDGADTYLTSLVHESGLSDGDPAAYIRVGRGLQPIGLAGYHVTPEI